MTAPVKFSEQTSASALGGTEIVPGVQSGSGVKILISQIGTYVRGLFTATPATIAEGGTNAATAAGARTSLGAAASGANTDITSLAAPALGAATATTAAAGDSSTKVATTAFVNGLAIPPGTVWDYAGATAPTGWLECDNSAVSRATYAALFTAIGTTWGAGDGATTFNVPDFRGRVRVGKGTGTITEAVTASSGNGFTVVANNTKWITGMAVVISNLTGFGGTISATTLYAVRISSTNVRFASTLALAQAGSPDITITGTGTATLTTALTIRALGEKEGEQSHAMSSSELLAHTHGRDEQTATAGGGGTLGRLSGANQSGSSGGNAAMNIMQPFAVTMTIIKT